MSSWTATVDFFAPRRRSMIESQLRPRGITDEGVLQAMERVPRHEFVAERYRDEAYVDHPLPIGLGQTISQPYIVAATLAGLSLQPSDCVLEIGTGSGYQTALLAELTGHVYSMERQETLAREAEWTLSRLGYTNITLVVGDGSRGFAERAPFDAIVVSAAAPRIPATLFEQLRDDEGRMIVPVGPPHCQELQLVRKRNGRAEITGLGGCSFVPLIGNEGYISGW